MHIDKKPLDQQSSESATKDTANNTDTDSYLGSITNYALSVPKIINNIATRAIRYVKNDIISVDEFNLLCTQADEELAVQQIKTTLSQYSYKQCISWVFTCLVDDKTPLEVADKNAKFKIIYAIAQIMEQKYKAEEKNVTPLGWLDVLNSNNIKAEGNWVNFRIFQAVEYVYSSSNDDDLQSLLYIYDKFPKNHQGYATQCASSSIFIFRARNENLEILNNFLRVLKENPYNVAHPASDLKVRFSYENVIKKIPSMLDMSMRAENPKFTEMLLKFYSEDTLIKNKK